MNIAILLAAGKSTRAGQNKLWADVWGQPLWTLSYKTLLAHREIDRVILVVPKGEELRFLPFIDSAKTLIVTGGETRMQSFKKGLEAAGELAANDVILDHNAANPNVTADEISAVISAAQKVGAAAVYHDVVDTLVEVEQTPKNSSGYNVSTRERANFRLMQTPQAVCGDVLQEVELAEATDLSTALLPHLNVGLIPASPLNKKITTAADLAALTAQTFLGEDSHRFSSEGQLVLGGLVIPDLPRLEANSDGDVILHAIGRALAQAAGQNFSELADPLMLGGDTDSRDYLAPLLATLTVRSVSLSLECARPPIDPLLPALKSSLAHILSTPQNAIHISAHTGEDLSPFGRGEGIRCTALVTLSKK